MDYTRYLVYKEPISAEDKEKLAYVMDKLSGVDEHFLQWLHMFFRDTDTSPYIALWEMEQMHGGLSTVRQIMRHKRFLMREWSFQCSEDYELPAVEYKQYVNAVMSECDSNPSVKALADTNAAAFLLAFPGYLSPSERYAAIRLAERGVLEFKGCKFKPNVGRKLYASYEII